MTVISELRQILGRDYEFNYQAATPLVEIVRAVQRESDAWPRTRVEQELRALGFKIQQLGAKKWVWGIVVRSTEAATA